MLPSKEREPKRQIGFHLRCIGRTYRLTGQLNLAKSFSLQRWVYATLMTWTLGIIDYCVPHCKSSQHVSSLPLHLLSVPFAWSLWGELIRPFLKLKIWELVCKTQPDSWLYYTEPLVHRVAFDGRGLQCSGCVGTVPGAYELFAYCEMFVILKREISYFEGKLLNKIKCQQTFG